MSDHCTLDEDLGPFDFKYGNIWKGVPSDPRGRGSKKSMSWGTFCDNCDKVERGSAMDDRTRWRSYCMPMTDDEASKNYGRQEEVEFCCRKCLDEWLAAHPEA
jgi:hypothetical protein